MPLFALQITKKVSFRGADQEFSNRYVYKGSVMTPGQAQVLATNVKALEVPLHSTDVTFLRWNVWTTGGTPSQNNMVNQGTLTGTGSQNTDTSFDRERAVLVQWPAGVNIRGQPVYLRKWFHSCGQCAGITFSAAQKQNTAQLLAADRTTIATAANGLRSPSNGDEAMLLSADSGRESVGAAVTHRYLEHHQLGDMWR